MLLSEHLSLYLSLTAMRLSLRGALFSRIVGPSLLVCVCLFTVFGPASMVTAFSCYYYFDVPLFICNNEFYCWPSLSQIFHKISLSQSSEDCKAKPNVKQKTRNLKALLEINLGFHRAMSTFKAEMSKNKGRGKCIHFSTLHTGQ